MDNNELLSEMKRLNRNIEWLRKKEMKQSFTATAKDIMSITGWTTERLRGERRRGTIRFKREGTKFRYDLSSLPDVYFTKLSTQLRPPVLA